MQKFWCARSLIRLSLFSTSKFADYGLLQRRKPSDVEGFLWLRKRLAYLAQQSIEV
jgi:hypothetical protein